MSVSSRAVFGSASTNNPHWVFPNVYIYIYLSDTINPITSNGRHKKVLAYPQTWADNFGKNYYVHAQAKEMESESSWNALVEGVPYKESDLQPTAVEDIEKNIHEILTDMKQEVLNDRRTDE